MFRTRHTDGSWGKIEYVVWSDVYSCPECANEIVFWNSCVDVEGGKVLSSFECPQCNSVLKKKDLENYNVEIFDRSLGLARKQNKQIPISINYSVNKSRFKKTADQEDLDLISKIDDMRIEEWHPTESLPNGVNTAQPIKSHGFSKVHDFYTRRNLAVLSKYREYSSDKIWSVLTAVALRITKRYALTYQSGVWGAGGGPTNGTYYIPSLIKELNMINMLEAAIKKQYEGRLHRAGVENKTIITTQSMSKIDIPDSSIDYVFIDPPFGKNLNYSELNFLWESWLKIFTENTFEAIENKVQGKDVDSYRALITSCFKEVYRVLKPGRWTTIEFSNTSAHIWNNLQTALYEAGFVVANVSALDKKKGSFKAQTTPTAVKQDLVISAYKPNGGFEGRFLKQSNEESVWDFVRTHLGYLPVMKCEGNDLIKILERDPRILFDQVVAFFVRNIRDVPLSSKEFQLGLSERFSERDGMFFLQEQVAQYDKMRVKVGRLQQFTVFVNDEASAIEWLRQELEDKPQAYQDLYPKFINELSGWKKAEEQLELSKILDQNFIRYDGVASVPTQINNYLTKNWHELRDAGRDSAELKKKAKDRWYVPNPDREEDLQKLRERGLLKHFEEYKIHTGRKLKTVRMEAVRCGFRKAWQDKDYKTIIQVAEKIPESLLQEDPKLLMWYDTAMTRESDSSLF
jgi:hypothetical protein